MRQYQFISVQELTVQLEFLPANPIERIAYDGIAHVFCVDSYLVRSPRLQSKSAEGILPAVPRLDFVIGDCRFPLAFGQNRHFQAIGRTASYLRNDAPRIRFDAAFEQSTGSSVSDYVAEQISQLDEESLLSSLEEDEESGVYKAADGKLYFEEQEADFSEEDYVSYTLEGGKLTFTSVTGDAMDLQSLSEMLGDLFPMVFTKQ